MGGLYPGGLIFGIIFLLANEWLYILGGLKPEGRALTWDFTVLQVSNNISKGIGVLTKIYHYTNIHILAQL